MAREDISLDDMLDHAGGDDPMDAIRGRRRGSIFGLGKKKKLGPDVPMAAPVAETARTYNANWAPMAAVAAPAPAGVPEAPVPEPESKYPVEQRPNVPWANDPVPSVPTPEEAAQPVTPVEKMGLGSPPELPFDQDAIDEMRKTQGVDIYGNSPLLTRKQIIGIKKMYPDFDYMMPTVKDLQAFLTKKGKK